MEATEYEFRIFAENETGLSRPRRTPMGIKTKLSGEMLQSSDPIKQNVQSVDFLRKANINLWDNF